MRCKVILGILIIVFWSDSSWAQLKIGQNGSTGLGIDPVSEYKLIIKGNVMLTTYPEIPAPLNRYTELRFKLGNGSPGCDIGTPTKGIAFWATEVGWNNITAAHYYTGSDTSIKTDIEPLSNAIGIISQLNPCKYRLRHDTIVDDKMTFGLLAQDVYNIIPNITDSVKGMMVIDYQQIIPLLVAAFKEQKQLIDSLLDCSVQQKGTNAFSMESDVVRNLTRDIKELNNQLTACCNWMPATELNKKPYPGLSSGLAQNRPNPFSETTVIDFEIMEDFRTAAIMIFDMQGILKRTLPVDHKGPGQVTILGYDLIPGMYLYSLVVDNHEIDTKRMILTD